jgi:hypothetical protein
MFERTLLRCFSSNSSGAAKSRELDAVRRQMALKGYPPLTLCLVYVAGTSLSIGNLEQCTSPGSECTTRASQWRHSTRMGRGPLGAPLAFTPPRELFVVCRALPVPA